VLGSILPMLASSAQGADVAKLATAGSPGLLRAAGRLLGLGEVQQDQLTQGRIPWWIIAVGGVALGVAAGVKLQQRYPHRIPAFLREDEDP